MIRLFDHNHDPAQTRIVVAMSGGVDSSVAAALLKESGYDVIGITLQLYDHGQLLQKKGACCAGQDIYDAAQVCERISIPHYVLDYESHFRQSVIDEFADSYLAGETPIPCIRCNQKVKFQDLLKTARDLNARAMVTGHYVQRFEKDGKAELHRAVDPTRDQSYFMFTTKQEQLDFLRFPLGGMEKSQTREHAKRIGLNVASKPDSQDICFVPDGNYADVVKRMRPDACQSGSIIHINGDVLGEHEGIIHYTIGQRRGLNVSYHEPLYVIRLDPKNNHVIVGPREALACKLVFLRDINWLGEELYDDGLEVSVKLRSTQNPLLAKVFQKNDGLIIQLDQPEYGISAGQAGVIYQGERVLGGGWITMTSN